MVRARGDRRAIVVPTFYAELPTTPSARDRTRYEYAFSAYIPWGLSGITGVYFRRTYGGFSDTVRYDSYDYVKVKKGLNEQYSCEIKLFGISGDDDPTTPTDDKKYVREDNEVLIFLGHSLYFKGIIVDVTYDSEDECRVLAFGMEYRLVEKEITDTEYNTNDANTTESATIFTAVAALSSDIALDGTNDGAWGYPWVRVQKDSALGFTDQVSKVTDQDWWLAYTGSTYSTNTLHVKATMGSDLSASVTLTTEGAGQNIEDVAKARDKDNVRNKVSILCYGDGENQIKTDIYEASGIYGYLNADITSTATSLVLKTITGTFPNAPAIIKIGREHIIYTANATGTDPLTFGTCQRDVASLLNKKHAKDVLAALIYNGSADTNSTLNGAITADATTITLADASSFAASGSIIIGQEIISYSGKSSNDLTGCSRDDTTYSTSNTNHTTGTAVIQFDSSHYFDASEARAASGTSINTWGLKEKRITDRRIISEKMAERLATAVWKDLNSPFSVVRLAMTDMYALNFDIGDIVTITDTNSNISGAWRCVRMDMEDSESRSNIVATFVSSTSGRYVKEEETYLDDRKSAEKGVDNMNTYMQGATNIFVVNETDNLDDYDSDGEGLTDAYNEHCMDIFFNIPTEAVGINAIKLAYRLEAPKTWLGTDSGASSETSTEPSNNTTTGTSSADTTGGSEAAKGSTGGSEGAKTSTGGSEAAKGSTGGSEAAKDTTSTGSTIHVEHGGLATANVTLNGTTPVPDENWAIGATDTTRVYIVVSVDGEESGGSKALWVRVNDGTTNWPSNTGQPVNFGLFDNSTIIVIPANMANKTLTLQFWGVGGASSTVYYSYQWHSIGRHYHLVNLTTHTHNVDLSSHTHNVDLTSHTHNIDLTSHTHPMAHTHDMQDHTHDMAHTHTPQYDLTTHTFDNGDIWVLTTNDASGSPTWTDRTAALEAAKGSALNNANNTSETNIDLTNFFSSTGWKGVRIAIKGSSGGAVRAKAQVIPKIFIESKT